MLDSKTGKCRTKHVDTRYHWIKEFVDNELVRVSYVKSENNVTDVLTKNLQPRLFEKHASELVTDVGFFVRCNTRLIGKAEPWEDTWWAKEEKLKDLAEPMGKIRKYDHMVMGSPNGTPIMEDSDN